MNTKSLQRLSLAALKQSGGGGQRHERKQIVNFYLVKSFADKIKAVINDDGIVDDSSESIFENSDGIRETMSIIQEVAELVLANDLPTEIPEELLTPVDWSLEFRANVADVYNLIHDSSDMDTDTFTSCWHVARNTWPYSNSVNQHKILRTLLCMIFGIRLPDVYELQYLLNPHELNSVYRCCPENSVVSSSNGLSLTDDIYLFFLVSSFMNMMGENPTHVFSAECQCMFCKWNPKRTDMVDPDMTRYALETPIRSDDSSTGQFVYMNLFDDPIGIIDDVTKLSICKDSFIPNDVVMFFNHNTVYKVDRTVYLEDVISKLKKHAKYTGGILFRIPSNLEITMEISKLYMYMKHFSNSSSDIGGYYVITYKKYINNKLLYIADCRLRAFVPQDADVTHVITADEESDVESEPESDDDD